VRWVEAGRVITPVQTQLLGYQQNVVKKHIANPVEIILRTTDKRLRVAAIVVATLVVPATRLRYFGILKNVRQPHLEVLNMHLGEVLNFRE
jgi:hypothetical protein